MISSRALAIAGALGTALLSASAARAATLYADIAAYGTFTYSLTTDDRNSGAFVGTGGDPSQTYHFATPLTLDTPYFIHVEVDGAGQQGFLGSFRVSDGNGASMLLTNTQDWGMASARWGTTKVLHYDAPVSLGFNGAAPLGFRDTIDHQAQVLWTSDSDCGDGCTLYFSAMVMASTQPVPEPSQALLLTAGLLALGGALRLQQ
jgi:hypothetical protein